MLWTEGKEAAETLREVPRVKLKCFFGFHVWIFVTASPLGRMYWRSEYKGESD